MLGEFNGFFIIKQIEKSSSETYVSCFSLHLFRALAASCVLYNRVEHSQGFSICQFTSSHSYFGYCLPDESRSVLTLCSRMGSAKVVTREIV